MDTSAYAWTGQPQTVRDLIAIWFQHLDSKTAQILKNRFGTANPPIYKVVPDHEEKQESCKARLIWFVEHLRKHQKNFKQDNSEEGQTLRWALERATQIVEIWAANRAHNLAMAGQGSPSATAKRAIAAYDSARLPVPEYIIAISKRKKVKAIKNQAVDPEVDEFVRLPNGMTVPSDSQEALAEYARLAKDLGKPVDRTNVADARRNLFEKQMNEYVSLFKNADRGEVEQEDINRAVRRLFVYAKTVRYFESPQLASMALELFRLRSQAFRSPRDTKGELIRYVSELVIRAQDIPKFVGNPMDWAAVAVSYCTDSGWLKQEIEDKTVFVSLTPAGWQKLEVSTFEKSSLLTREEILALPKRPESTPLSLTPLVISVPKFPTALDLAKKVKVPDFGKMVPDNTPSKPGKKSDDAPIKPNNECWDVAGLPERIKKLAKCLKQGGGEMEASVLAQKDQAGFDPSRIYHDYKEKRTTEWISQHIEKTGRGLFKLHEKPLKTGSKKSQKRIVKRSK